MVNGRIVEAECSISYDPIIPTAGLNPEEDQASALREAIDRHARNRHSLKDSGTAPRSSPGVETIVEFLS
jgi:hypothetical protein